MYLYIYVRIDIYVYTFILDVCFLAMHSLAKCPVGGVNSSNHLYWSECVRGCSLSRSWIVIDSVSSPIPWWQVHNACPPCLHTNSSHCVTTAVNQHPNAGTLPRPKSSPHRPLIPEALLSTGQTDRQTRESPPPPHTLTVPSPVLGWGCKWLAWLRLSCISRGRYHW